MEYGERFHLRKAQRATLTLRRSRASELSKTLLSKDPQNSIRNRGFAFIEYYNHPCAEYSRQKMSKPEFKLDDNAPTVSWTDPQNAESSASSQSSINPMYRNDAVQNSESSHNAVESLSIRKLEIADKRKGFIELLQQLTACDSVSDRDFEVRFEELSLYGDDHLVCVIEDNLSGKILATGSVFIEKKFIRNCGKVGHIEDIVVDSKARGLQLGKKVIGFLSDHARSMGCYKLILDCSTDNKVFYERCGFKHKEIQMVKYFT